MTSAMIWAGAAGSLLLWCGLSIKWRFRLRSAFANAVIAFSGTIGLMAAAVRLIPSESPSRLAAVETAFLVLVSAALIAFQFYRDPEREAPRGEGLIVSPADGTVRYVRRLPVKSVPQSRKKGVCFPLKEFVRFTGFGDSELVQFGIEMNVLNVHINRSPISGKVVFKERVRGRFLSLRDREALSRNERMVHVIEDGGIRVAVVQIASRLVRRIVSYCEVGETLKAGQRIGMIRFGSQVDLVMPYREDLRIRVRPGAKTLAGETVLAAFEKKNR